MGLIVSVPEFIYLLYLFFSADSGKMRDIWP